MDSFGEWAIAALFVQLINNIATAWLQWPLDLQAVFILYLFGWLAAVGLFVD